ncbi:Integrase core domain-containing protein [Anaerovirgula multivorans]|uniref:Integrase core domain-containing protein n=1 Tax=Anaerovirgula multivorans TaxID=312168 RepID=A0A239JEW5_9FIRM|nr:Integrase core domain-containing protein [Anaerovirgula multivorans]
MLKLLGVSTSGYYDWLKRKPSKQKIRKQKIKEEITEIYNESKQIYGAPKITSVLESRGHIIAEKTVGNYMREEGIKAIWVRPYTRTTIDPDFDTKLKNVLSRDFNPTAPNAVWVTDITYVHTLSGFVYLTSVMDLFSRKIVGWHLSDHLTTEGEISSLAGLPESVSTI